MPARIAVDSSSLSEFCRRYHILKLALFGSVLRADFRPDSDVDVLVEFDPSHRPGMVRFHEIEQELSNLHAGHRVDLVSPRFLNHRIRDQVLAEAEVQFAER